MQARLAILHHQAWLCVSGRLARSGQERTSAALFSRPLSSLSKAVSQPSSAFAKFQRVGSDAALESATAVLLTAWSEATNAAIKGWKSLTNTVLSALNRSSTYVSWRMRWYATWKRGTGHESQGEREGTYDKDEFKIIDERPPDGISVFLVLLFCSATFYESVPDETIDWGCRGRSQLRSVWSKRAGPKDDPAWQRMNKRYRRGERADLCALSSSGRACRRESVYFIYFTYFTLLSSHCRKSFLLNKPIISMLSALVRSLYNRMMYPHTLRRSSQSTSNNSHQQLSGLEGNDIPSRRVVRRIDALTTVGTAYRAYTGVCSLFEVSESRAPKEPISQ